MNNHSRLFFCLRDEFFHTTRVIFVVCDGSAEERPQQCSNNNHEECSKDDYQKKRRIWVVILHVFIYFLECVKIGLEKGHSIACLQINVSERSA